MTPAPAAARPSRRPRGFSLVETIVALSIVVAVLLGLVQLFMLATRGNDRARVTTLTAMLAAAQVDRVRALAWGFDAASTRRSDITTDLTVSPEASGGIGLWPSPGDALDRNVNGYSDYLDRDGRPLAPGGGEPPPRSAFVRRWSISPLTAHPLDGLVIQVRVLPIESVHSAARVAVGESRLLSVLSRKAR